MGSKNNQFLWGAATSAHQVEGNNTTNDWWEWEHATSERIHSGKAADHFHRFREDFAIIERLGHTAHRLSLEWSRLEPKQGQWHSVSVEHYREVLRELKWLRIKTFVTLHHFTNPLWFAQEGGWRWEDAPERFSSYAKRAAESFGDLVDYWITINEPNVLAAHGYWFGWWPPQQKSLVGLMQASRLLVKAHQKAYSVIHEVLPHAQVGIAPSIIGYFPARARHPGDMLAAWYADWSWNHMMAKQVVSMSDFWGLQYYFSRYRQFGLKPPFITNREQDGPTTDMGWPINPRGLAQELRHFSSYGLPIYITENGLADADDSRREQYIRDHVSVVEQAQKEGIDIRGYLYWSLLDNFEWAEGFTPRFGLVEVDYATMERRIRPSAYAYTELMQQVAGRLSRTVEPLQRG
jgi:beta-glucosidase